MKIVAQPGASVDQPLEISEGTPDTTYELVFQDTGLQRITRVTITTDGSGDAVAQTPVAFGIGAWAVSAVPADGTPPVAFVGVDEGDGSFIAVDIETAITTPPPFGSDVQRSSKAGSTYTPSE